MVKHFFSHYATFRILNRVINSNSSKVALKSFVCFNFTAAFGLDQPEEKILELTRYEIKTSVSQDED